MDKEITELKCAWCGKIICSPEIAYIISRNPGMKCWCNDDCFEKYKWIWNNGAEITDDRISFEDLKKFKDSTYIVNYIENKEMKVKEFQTIKAATEFAHKCENFRRIGLKIERHLYNVCEAKDLESVYNTICKETNNGKKKS